MRSMCGGRCRGDAGCMPLIEVTDLHKSYGGRHAVDGVSLTVDEGEILGILGPNGAGKTTLVECIAGLRAADAGTVRVAGRDPRAERGEVTRVLGVQLQEGQLQDKITVLEALELFAAFYDDPLPIPPLAGRLGLSDQLATRFAKLSGGQKQRLFVALALIGRPRAVILDELTTGLDPRARHEVWGLVEEIRADGVAVLLVSHFMEEVQRLCDRIALVQRGRVTALDTPTGLVARTDSSVVISFVPSEPVPLDGPDGVRGLPALVSAEQRGPGLVLNGPEELVDQVLTDLAARGVKPGRLRITDATLDDAFLALTEPHEGDS